MGNVRMLDSDKKLLVKKMLLVSNIIQFREIEYIKEMFENILNDKENLDYGYLSAVRFKHIILSNEFAENEELKIGVLNFLDQNIKMDYELQTIMFVIHNICNTQAVTPKEVLLYLLKY